MQTKSLWINDVQGRTLFARAVQCQSARRPTIVLLHASPLSSETMLPLMEILQTDFDVIAFDTPGYGHSDAIDAQNLLDYGAQFVFGLRQLGIEQFHLYGAATGAQIALELSKAYQNRVQSLWMEGACHFEAPARVRILSDYFPDLSPRADGSHLVLIWQICQRLFQAFPWFSEDPNDQLDLAQPPIAVLQTFFNGYLKAGPDYARAYRMAFNNEHAGQFLGLAVPTRIITRADSILAKHTAALLAQDLPTCVQACAIASGPERFAALKSQMLRAIQSTHPAV
jgi:pimeloyl-ACP methyl ester carboxylesterase